MSRQKLAASSAAKVRCRTCYSDHDYRNEQAPPSKKELKKAALFNEVLAGLTPAPAEAEAAAELGAESEGEDLKKAVKKPGKRAQA